MKNTIITLIFLTTSFVFAGTFQLQIPQPSNIVKYTSSKSVSQSPSVLNSFSVNYNDIVYGDNVTLSWDITNKSTVILYTDENKTNLLADVSLVENDRYVFIPESGLNTIYIDYGQSIMDSLEITATNYPLAKNLSYNIQENRTNVSINSYNGDVTFSTSRGSNRIWSPSSGNYILNLNFSRDFAYKAGDVYLDRPSFNRSYSYYNGNSGSNSGGLPNYSLRCYKNGIIQNISTSRFTVCDHLKYTRTFTPVNYMFGNEVNSYFYRFKKGTITFK